MKKIVFLFLTLVSISAEATRVYSVGTIEKLYSYSEQGAFDGDIIIKISNAPKQCPGGYWLRKAETPGYKNTVSFLLSAFHSGSKVTISALSDQANIWSGSSTTTCRMDQVSLEK